MVTVDGALTDAKRERHRLRAEGRPVHDPEPAAPVTLNDLAATYLRAKSAVLAPRTISIIDTDYRLRIAPVLGHLALPDITRERVEGFLAALVAASPTRRMVTGTIASLRGILAAGVEWGRLTDNPAARLRMPAPDHERQAVERTLTMEQLAALFGAARTLRIETMIRAGGEAGLRRGEVIGLRWDDVDLAGRRLHVRRNVTQATGSKTERTTKGRRTRRVAISETFTGRLAAWFEEAVVRSGADAAGPVWPGRGGALLDAGSPGQALARTMERAGLVDADGVPLVTFHGLRHTAASVMLAAGVPLIDVSHMLGHANPQVTAQVYAHRLSDRQLDGAAAVFDRLPGAETVRETVRGPRA